MAEFRSRRRAIGLGLVGSWLVITVVNVLYDSEILDALLWIAIFALSASTSAMALAEVSRVVRRIRSKRVPPERLLAQKVNEVRVRGYQRSEAIRLLTSSLAIAVGLAAALRLGGLTVPLFFGMALGILGNTLLEREDRREQRYLVEVAEVEEVVDGTT